MAKPYKKYTPEELDAAIEEQIKQRRAARKLWLETMDARIADAAFRKWRNTRPKLRGLNAEKRRRIQERIKKSETTVA